MFHMELLTCTTYRTFQFVCRRGHHSAATFENLKSNKVLIFVDVISNKEWQKSSILCKNPIVVSGHNEPLMMCSIVKAGVEC